MYGNIILLDLKLILSLPKKILLYIKIIKIEETTKNRAKKNLLYNNKINKTEIFIKKPKNGGIPAILKRIKKI